MQNNLRSSRLIMNEMERLQSLSGEELKSYISELRTALYHERKAMNAREFRLREKLNAVTNAVTEAVTKAVTDTETVTESVTEAVTEAVTQPKEERSEKENLPPTPPIREKAKKEEMPPYGGNAPARTHEAGMPNVPTWEMVVERARVSLMCYDLDWLKAWYAEQDCSGWRDGKGHPLHNWGRALAIAWRYRDIDEARRDPERHSRDEEEYQVPDRIKNLIAEQMAQIRATAEKAVR